MEKLIDEMTTKPREAKRTRWLGMRDRMLKDFGIDTPEVRRKLAEEDEQARSGD